MVAGQPRATRKADLAPQMTLSDREWWRERLREQRESMKAVEKQEVVND